MVGNSQVPYRFNLKGLYEPTISNSRIWLKEPTFVEKNFTYSFLVSLGSNTHLVYFSVIAGSFSF
jgi:hypothetical protein